VEKLLTVLHRLVDAGNTVIVIEHNLDVVKTADWIIDLGPDGGDAGGEVVAAGTPEMIAGEPRSATGEYLRPIIAAAAGKGGRPHRPERPAAVVETPLAATLPGSRARPRRAGTAFR
jgi:excinuclease ABC subunit A